MTLRTPTKFGRNRGNVDKNFTKILYFVLTIDQLNLMYFLTGRRGEINFFFLWTICELIVRMLNCRNWCVETLSRETKRQVYSFRWQSWNSLAVKVYLLTRDRGSTVTCGTRLVCRVCFNESRDISTRDPFHPGVFHTKRKMVFFRSFSVLHVTSSPSLQWLFVPSVWPFPNPFGNGSRRHHCCVKQLFPET